jgi:hypothetical protein
MSNPFLTGYTPRPSPHVPSDQIGFVFEQATPATTWTISHNLGVKPDVSLYTVGGVEFEAEVIHISNDVCVAYLVTPMAGFARLV